VAAVFRKAGFEVVLMAELYPDGEDQLVDDDRWINEVGSLGMVALTKDAPIVRAHTSALRDSTLRVFALSNANLTGPQMAERFQLHLHRIVQRSRRPGPFVDVVRASAVTRRWPTELDAGQARR
jgi:hypothetical protein